jgi:succinylglutamate desuccinylase
MITTEGIQEIAQSILDLVDHAEVQMKTETKELQLYKTSIDVDTLKVFIMLDDTVVGDIQNIKLIGKSGNVLLENPQEIIKNATKGLLVVFSIKVVEVAQ